MNNSNQQPNRDDLKRKYENLFHKKENGNQPPATSPVSPWFHFENDMEFYVSWN